MKFTEIEIAVLMLILHDARINADIKGDKPLSLMLLGIIEKLQNSRMDN